MNTKELAALMGQKESDVISFVNCLRVWTAKGYTLEQAIEKHMAQMGRFVNASLTLPKSLVVETFFPVAA